METKGEERGLRKGSIVSLSPQGMTSCSSSIKIWFFQLIECIIKKKRCHGVKQYAKICTIGEQNVVFILGGQRIDQKRRRRERIEKGSRERIEIERKETNGN